MQVWRICKRIYLNSSFSGQGGIETGGRWHRKGNRIVYASQSLSLAALESWLHVAPMRPLPRYVAVSAAIPDDFPIFHVEEDALPVDWRNLPPLHPELQRIGTEWLESGQFAVARVPSVIIRGEFNFLLNPLHGDFPMIKQGAAMPFEFDPRMWKNAP